MNNLFFRSSRISEEIKKEIMSILYRKIRDPRINCVFITISHVKLSRDLSSAKIFVTLYNNDEKNMIRKTMNILIKASDYIRIILRKNLNLRVVPKLSFVYDDSLVKGIYISNIINKTMNIK
ncbi:30S ribosome-binding factor [Buchnera aphidicola (Neophyllaphis podocarpi)]|uniref:30S ribosome-binding factor RbfA n=1 Tax=Buchnera aphidicola TaxID=9 RepID=UPI0034649C92